MKQFCKINNDNMPTIMFGRTVAQNSFQANVKGDKIIPIPEVANGIYILVIEEASGELLESIRLNVMK